MRKFYCIRYVYFLAVIYSSMTLSLNCKDSGDPVCNHTMYGETEQDLLENVKIHAIEAHGFTEESFNEEVRKNIDNIRNIIKTV